MKSIIDKINQPDGKLPANETASETLARMLNAGRPHREYDWNPPGTNITIPIRIQVLSMLEESQAKMNAKRKLDRIGYERTSDNDPVFADETAVQILWMAIRDTNPEESANGKSINYAPAFKTVDEIRELTPDQVVSLFNLYLAVQAEFGETDMTIFVRENLDEWIDMIGKGVDATPFLALSQLPSPDLVQLSLALAEHLYEVRSQYLNSPVTSESDQKKSATENGSSTEDASNTPKVLNRKQAREQVSKKQTGNSKKSKTSKPDLQPIDMEAAAEIARTLNKK